MPFHIHISEGLLSFKKSMCSICVFQNLPVSTVAEAGLGQLGEPSESKLTYQITS